MTRLTIALVLAFSCASALGAQQDHDHDAPQQPAGAHQHDTGGDDAAAAAPVAQDPHAGHVMTSGLFSMREASGTAWLPDIGTMYALHQNAGRWELMFHGNAFVQYLHERAEAPRGADQFGSINWVMGMARRQVGAGRLGLRGMISLEPATIPGCGYPDLLATGETCEGHAIVDRQHPHDFLMEVAAEYERPLRGSVRWQVYAGLAGEPTLGPVAYPHRLSALPNALAPISHHWLDATHITFGVISGGVFGPRWKAEGSVFNGREPDEERWALDLAALDSYAGRFWFLPTPSVAVQISAGHLNEAEPGHDGPARIDVERMTASVTYHRLSGTNRLWAATVGWGRNVEAGTPTHAALFESAFTVNDRHTWFGRVEIVGKAAHDLDVHGSEDVFTVSKLQAGYTHYLQPWRGVAPGIGGALSLGIVPSGLKPTYGGRANVGFGVYVTLRPGTHRM